MQQTHASAATTQVLVNIFCFSEVFILFFNLNLLFQYDTSGHITDNVDAGCAHVAECVDADINAHHASRETRHGSQRGERSDCTTGDAGGATDKITFASRITIIMEVLTSTPQALAKKHDHERQHDGNRIHVDRCAQRDSDTGDFIGYAHLVLHTLLAEGDGGRTGTGAKGVQSCRQAGFNKLCRACLAKELDGTAIHDSGK